MEWPASPGSCHPPFTGMPRADMHRIWSRTSIQPQCQIKASHSHSTELEQSRATRVVQLLLALCLLLIPTKNASSIVSGSVFVTSMVSLATWSAFLQYCYQCALLVALSPQSFDLGGEPFQEGSTIHLHCCCCRIDCVVARRCRLCWCWCCCWCCCWWWWWWCCCCVPLRSRLSYYLFPCSA